MHTSLRTLSVASAGPVASLAQRISILQRSPAYLRHAPPSLYVTCDNAPSATSLRHTTRLLDCGYGAPATHGVYVLSSTVADDYSYSREGTVRSVMVGLPRCRTEAEIRTFLERNAHYLTGLESIALTDVHSDSGLALKVLCDLYPNITVSCSAFAAAFFTDETFFSGVRAAILENDNTAIRDTVVFAALSAASNTQDLGGARVHTVQDNDTLPVSRDVSSVEEVKSASHSPRVLRALCVANPHQSERLKKARKHYPVHYIEQPVYWYDTAFQSLHIGVAVQHVPWLPRIMQEASTSLLLPTPPLMASKLASRGSPLLHTWRVEEHVASIRHSFSRVSGVQHVLTSSYGALPGNAADCVEGLESACERLEGLRSRLARRLETDTARDAKRWSGALLDRILTEVVCVNTASSPTEGGVKAEVREWAAADGLGELAAALTHAALSLPPTTAPTETEGAASKEIKGDEFAKEDREAARTEKQHHRQQQGARDESTELEGASGVALMKSIFAKKNLSGLSPVLAREEIDVRVFIAMSPDDFKKVFKATFGVSKKLELLQVELRKKM